MEFLFTALLVLGGIGCLAAAILYWCSVRFAVHEDPRIAQVNALLPGANCGGCGFAGCNGMAEALVKGADNGGIDGLNCPVGGAKTMAQVADTLHLAAGNAAPKIAVVRCNGNCDNRPRTVDYGGLRSCGAMHLCGNGETGCGYGCLGCGDCVSACQFEALHMNPQTGLPEVDQERCTACGACAKVCPRHVIELRKKGPKDRRVFVACVNRDKGAVAMKACKAACIGCGKCAKECQFEAITVEGQLSYIDAEKCRLCRKCVEVCPTKAIHAVNFPQPKTIETN